jgi:hypothetical protein
MSEIATIKCDECGKLRISDSNHWFEGATDGVEIRVAAVGKLPLWFDERSGTRAKPKHFCGQECVMKWFGIKMGEL